MCQWRFNELGELEKNLFFKKSYSARQRIFAHAFPESRAAINLASFLVSQNNEHYSDFELVIHNGDVIPTTNDFSILASKFSRVHSVNWLGRPDIANPLPIGLENFAKVRNGVPRDYSRHIKKGLKPFQDRDIELLICFSLHTNREARTLALEASEGIPSRLVVLEPITPRAYRKLVLRSKYVLSPPGNGPDCHRTWESIYLGAIPIVWKSAWPNFRYQLPVLSIEDWSQLKVIVSSQETPAASSIQSPENWLN
jgi:hypothetical protein